MLVRLTLPTCRATLRSSGRALATPLAARANSTAAADAPAPTTSEPQAADAPVHKPRIPVAEAWADLAIPQQDEVRRAAKKYSPVGGRFLSQDQFAGRGSLTAALTKRRMESPRPNRPQRATTERPATDSKKPTTPQQTQKAAQKAAPRNAEEVAAAKAEKAKERAEAEEAARLKAEEEGIKNLVENADLQGLFAAPAPSSSRVVALELKASKAAQIEQRALEKNAGDYFYYLPRNLGAHPGGTMTPKRVVGYAHLAMARDPRLSLKRRTRAVKTLQTLVWPQGSKLSGARARATA